MKKTPNVKSSDFHHLIYIKKPSFEVYKWCESQFGARWNPINSRSGRWTAFWAGPRCTLGSEYYQFQFVDEKDAIMFTLKWK